MSIEIRAQYMTEKEIDELISFIPTFQNSSNKTKEKTMKNVLFLAPGYQYAKTVVSNQAKELDRKRIPFNASVAPHDMYIRTDKVHVEIYYEDPINWTGDLFRHRDAVFGKEELVNKAHKTYFHVVIAPKGSLSKYISNEHKNNTSEEIEAPTAYIPEIAKVHFNDPMTVVIWEDGTKTVVKCQEGDTFDHEKGIAMAFVKKCNGNTGSYCDLIKEWVPKKVEK